MSRMFSRISLAIALCFFVISFPLTNTQAAVNQADDSQSTIPLEAGSRLQTSAWSIVHIQSQEQDTVEIYEVFTARGKYVLATLQIDNLTNLPLQFPYADLALVDEQGRSYAYQDAITANLMNDLYDPLFVYSLLQPSLSYETVVVFEVSTEATSLMLSLKSDAGERASEAQAGADEARSDAQPIGSTIEFGGWVITVEGTEIFESYTSVWGTHAPRGQFLAVYNTATNIGTEQAYFPYEDLRLVDGTGRWFSNNQSPTDGLSLDLTGQQYWELLQPGIPYQLGVMFDVPFDSSELLLVGSLATPSIAVEI